MIVLFVSFIGQLSALECLLSVLLRSSFIAANLLVAFFVSSFFRHDPQEPPSHGKQTSSADSPTQTEQDNRQLARRTNPFCDLTMLSPSAEVHRTSCQVHQSVYLGTRYILVNVPAQVYFGCTKTNQTKTPFLFWPVCGAFFPARF